MVTTPAPHHGLVMLCPCLCPIQGLAGPVVVADVEPKILEMKILFLFASSSPSHMPPMCVSTLRNISSPLRISNTFTDVKANVLKGPRGWSTILFMPLVQLSHFGLLPVDRNSRETSLCVENEYKDLAIDFVPAFSSPTVYSEGGMIKDKDGMIKDQARKRWWQWLTFSPLSWRGTRTPGG